MQERRRGERTLRIVHEDSRPHAIEKRGEMRLDVNILPSDTAIVLATGPDIVWKALLGRPVLAWSLRTFELAESVDRIALVVTPERAHEAEVLAHVEAWRKT